MRGRISCSGVDAMGVDQWRSNVEAGPCAKIPKGSLITHTWLVWGTYSDGPACIARFAHHTIPLGQIWGEAGACLAH